MNSWKVYSGQKSKISESSLEIKNWLRDNTKTICRQVLAINSIMFDLISAFLKIRLKKSSKSMSKNLKEQNFQNYNVAQKKIFKIDE